MLVVRAWDVPALDFTLPMDSFEVFAPSAVCVDLDELMALGADSGVAVHDRLVRGGAAAVLLDAGDDASMLVVGSRGLGGFRRLLIGSVSSQCATHARVPTVVVPAASKVEQPASRITVGLDGSEHSLDALSWALDFAPEKSTIQVLGAWWMSRSGFTAVAQHYTHDFEHAQATFHELLDDVESSDRAGRVLERHFAFADPATALLKASSEADLVVVGERGHTGVAAAMLGSVATHLVHRSKVPVVVVPSTSNQSMPR